MSESSSHAPDDIDGDMLAAEQSRARHKARRERRHRAQRVVTAICIVSTAAGMLAPGDPTGAAALDVAYRALFALLVTGACSRAKRWTWFVLAGAAGAAATDDVLPFALAGAALAVAFGSVLWGRRQRELGAVVGALAVQSLLRLPTELPFAVPTAVAALAPAPVYLSALRNVRRPGRYLWPAFGLTVALGVVGAAFLFAMIDVEGRAGSGIRSARAGVAAASAGDDAAAESSFAAAEAELAAAAETADAWWLAPARAVPVLAQHVQAVDEVAEEGRALAALSADQVATLDITGLSRPGGGIDLERVAALQPRARTVARALERALDVAEDASSPWLVPPAADRLGEFAAEMADALPAARNAADALDVAPFLLGADDPRHYLVLVGNPAEARELGGFVGAVGVLRVERGVLGFDAVGSIPVANAAVHDSGLTVDRSTLPPPLAASDPNTFVQNWTNTADWLLTGRVATELGPGIAGASVDGVLYLDPYAVAALLEITGPVPVQGRAEPLAAASAVDFLLRDQYQAPEFDTDGERKELLRDAAEAAFDRLASAALPDPRRLADVLSPAVRARRLLFTTTATDPHGLLTRIGLRPPLDPGAPDQVLVAQQNLRTNKLDAYLQRDVAYDATVDDAGNLTGTLTVELTNSAPAEGLGPYVTGDGTKERTVDPLPETLNLVSLAAYTRFEVVEVTVDGQPQSSAAFPIDDLWRTAVRVPVPTMSTVTVTFTLAGTVDPGGYSLVLAPNAAAGVDTVAATVDSSGVRTRLDRRPFDQTFRLHPKR